MTTASNGDRPARSGGIGDLWERWQLASARVPFGVKNAADFSCAMNVAAMRSTRIDVGTTMFG